MSNRSEQPVKLTSYSIKKQESLDTYLDEWQSIKQSRNSADSEEEKDEQGNSEAIWLEKLGFGNYVSQIQTGDGSDVTDDAYLKDAGLNRHYTHVVRRRMNTLRSTVKSRNRKQDAEKKGEDTSGDGGGDQGGSKMNGTTSFGSQNNSSITGRSTTPTSSPRNSPIPSRRSPNFYNVASSEHSKRNGHNIDSGVYSASSSRDGTPVRNHHEGPAGGHYEAIRGRTKVLTSPKHRCSSSDLPGEGVLLDDEHTPHHRAGARQRIKINPMSLNLASKSISNSPVSQRRDIQRRIHATNDPHSNDDIIMIERCSSEAQYPSSKHSDQPDVSKHEAMSLSHQKNGKRSISPSSSIGSRLGGTSSPEDIKLHFGNDPHHHSNGATGPDDMQELPTFMISPDQLGITRINDLSLKDMEKVRSVALLELTVTFDDHEIPLRSHRPARTKNYYPENSLSGVPLSYLLQVDQKREPQATIPLIYEEIISHLEKHCLENEGLLRIPGSVSRVHSILQDLEFSFHFGQFSFSGIKSNDICSLLKQLIRELPVPLLTREYLTAFASIAEISDLKEQVRTLNLLVLLLPDIHQKVLKRLLEFCVRIIQHSSVNKMDLTNVAMVIAPNLFITLPARHTLEDVTLAGKTSHVVRLLIKYHEVLWTIPGEMLRQIRYLYENEVRRLNQRTVQKALKQMQHQQQPNKSASTKVSHHIVRVKAPLFTRVCMAVDICVGVTAGDIISKLQKKSRLNKDVIKKRFSSSNVDSWPYGEFPDDNTNRLRIPEEMGDAGEQFLFEQGGNIGERCLPNDTDMYTLYGVNPNAQWIIKPRGCPDLN